MFWKNDNSIRFKSLSLVTKLMLFYSISTIGLLASIGLFLYPTFAKMLAQMNGLAATAFTAECYEKAMLVLLIGSLGAILFGHVIARQGLHRMREFEDKMEQMTADSLHEHIDLTEWPKELKSFGSKFNTMLNRIHQSFVQLSQFSSDIAHELRTPIHNLKGMTEVALSSQYCAPEHRLMLESYMSEFQYLSKLIENLLFLARSEHGQLVIKKELINVHTEIVKLCEYYQAIADEKEIELICEGDAEIMADSILFRRIISNLLSNALKYTNSHGKITISIRAVNQWVEVSIQDSGIGIPADQLDRIFDRFYRIDPSRSAQSGGLGLGLSIVKAIMDLHQGKIKIESQLNEGTCVHLKLPTLSKL